jgi:hypothetical protein
MIVSPRWDTSVSHRWDTSVSHHIHITITNPFFRNPHSWTPSPVGEGNLS